jgi:hypothetical protein
MQKEQFFRRALFDARVLRDAISIMKSLDDEIKWGPGRGSVQKESAAWTFDNDEEFFAEYSSGFSTASYHLRSACWEYSLLLDTRNTSDELGTAVTVAAPRRSDIERVMNVFADNFAGAIVAHSGEDHDGDASPTKVFIGHGHSPLWRDLKDHLHDQHGYDVTAYETGARGGHNVRDILEEMLSESSFAILVMTAEDVTKDGTKRARQNVVHEAGLFQGRLGFSRALILMEEGVEEFSNIQGLHQIRYSTGNIKETFGDVLATLKRELN